ncbi:MAG: hypothetical protein Ta2D_06820 [Rickettsiales bacterium]|nr:MAG: hypothetical protein Ta2D_06820 [Rickettsiales bacterium]
MREETQVLLKDALQYMTKFLKKPLEYTDDLLLMGSDGNMDSMDLVTFLSEVEGQISDKLSKDVKVVSNKAFSQTNSPFKSMETLSNYIEELVK